MLDGSPISTLLSCEPHQFICVDCGHWRNLDARQVLDCSDRLRSSSSALEAQAAHLGQRSADRSPGVALCRTGLAAWPAPPPTAGLEVWQRGRRPPPTAGLPPVGRTSEPGCNQPAASVSRARQSCDSATLSVADACHRPRVCPAASSVSPKTVGIAFSVEIRVAPCGTSAIFTSCHEDGAGHRRLSGVSTTRPSRGYF